MPNLLTLTIRMSPGFRLEVLLERECSGLMATTISEFPLCI